MLTDALKVMVNNLFKENFDEKKKEKVINVFTVFFFIFHKSCVKNFPKIYC